MPVKDDAIQGLNGGRLVALKDTHTDDKARKLAAGLIDGDYVKVFFIEYSSRAKASDQHYATTYGSLLNAAISEMLDTHLTQQQARDVLVRGRYFAKLSLSDASPSLLELTAQCIGKGVQVVACDMEPADVLKALDTASPQYAPHKETSLIAGWGLAERDKFTAQMIGTYLKRSNVTTGKLVMWGANHFVDHTDRGGVAPLDRLLKDDQGLIVEVLTP